jgi:hypothetical protein
MKTATRLTAISTIMNQAKTGRREVLRACNPSSRTSSKPASLSRPRPVFVQERGAAELHRDSSEIKSMTEEVHTLAFGVQVGTTSVQVQLNPACSGSARSVLPADAYNVGRLWCRGLEAQLSWTYIRVRARLRAYGHSKKMQLTGVQVQRG